MAIGTKLKTEKKKKLRWIDNPFGWGVFMRKESKWTGREFSPMFGLWIPKMVREGGRG